MKNIARIFILVALAGLTACEDADNIKPVPATSPSTFTAKFLQVNASPDAPPLDLFINNVMVGAAAENDDEGLVTYSTVSLTSNGVIANTNIRTRAASGTIGGILGSSDLIYRAGNANTTNFTAANNALYTLFVVDTIARPKPLRTLNASNFGDITYYSSKNSYTGTAIIGGGDTTIYLNVQNFGVDDTSLPIYASNNSVVAYKLVSKYYGGAPPFMTPIGIVPLGSSDVGGLRYYLWQDGFAAFSAADSTSKAAFRVLHASPNAPPLAVRLKFVSGTGGNITLSGSSLIPYAIARVVSNAGVETPSVGSRTVTATPAFSPQTIAPAGTPNTYDIEVATDLAFTNIIATKAGVQFGGSANKASNYSIVVSGLVGGAGSEALRIRILEHN